MGTIQRRSDNKGLPTWQARIRRKGHPWLSRNFATREKAASWIAQVEAEFARNKHAAAIEADRAKLSRSTDPLNLPFSYLIERYISEVTPTKRSAEVEGIRLRALQKEHISMLTLSQLTREALVAWRDKRLTEVSADTVLRDLGSIGHIIEIARREWGVELPLNPVRLVRKPKPNPSRERRLRPGEEAALLREADNSKSGFLRSVISLALETAMRQGEIVSLDWEHVHLEQRRLYLPLTKNGSSRGVPLSLRAKAVLEALPTRDGQVFAGVTREAVKRAFQNARKRASLVDLHFHDLRHEAISRLFEKGLNMMEVASISGHRTLTMLKRYTHLDAGKLASRLD